MGREEEENDKNGGGERKIGDETASSLSDGTGLVCVTGGTGFVASWLIMRLLQRGYSVRATVRTNPGFNRFSLNSIFVNRENIKPKLILILRSP